MAQVKVGSNEIDVTLGVVAVNGYGGQKDDEGGGGVPLKVNPEWARDPARHYEKQLRVVEDASGRKDGWVNDPKVAKWAFKPWGVNTDLVAPRRAPYLAVTDANRDLLWGPEVAASRRDFEIVLEKCRALYVGSTWGGDNAESPRAICPRHLADLACVLGAFPDRASFERICFDQGAAVLDDGENEAAFIRLATLIAAKHVTPMVEALPKNPRDLEWVGALARYAYLTERGVLGGEGWYRVPKGARLTVLFDGKVLRDQAGELTPANVRRVVEWAAAYGVEGHGAKSLELLIAGPQHAKAVVEWAAEHGVL